jgi:hypothetical protein
MDSYRADLDHIENGTSYFILTSIFLILSAIGLYLIFVYLPNQPSPPGPQLSPDTITETPTDVPTSIPTDYSLPTDVPLTPGPNEPTLPAKAEAAVGPLPAFINYQSPTDNFSVTYASSRKLYEDSEFSGRRYTFYSDKGNFAIHVGSLWSWTHPDRTFSNALLVDGHNTFRYNINTQTLIDLQDKSKNYTIQCVHNGLAALKTECDQFLKSFKFLKL